LKTPSKEPGPEDRTQKKGEAREAISGLAGMIKKTPTASPAPRCATFKEFLRDHARVLQRDGAGGPFSLAGRAPLEVVVDWLDKVLRNTIGPEAQGPETVEIDGAVFQPGQLKGATLAVAGGAQFGKTVLELNLMAYATAIRFLSVGNYLPDRPKVEEIVGQKFRPNVLDLYPWMAEMIQLGKVQNASGKTINRKESYTVTDGQRKSFGNFCGMHRPPTSLTLDLALLDEVDDIDERNIGYVDARMTNSQAHLTCFIGTQRVAGAGQNARLEASSFHVKLVPCPACGREWCLEEEFPRCVRVKKAEIGKAESRKQKAESQNTDSISAFNFPISALPDPIISPEMGHDRLAAYYVACPECGTELDRDAGRYVARRPERLRQAKLGIRVSQLNISAISIQEIVGAWYAAFEDPSGSALTAFCCDRLAIPNAGAAQPITQAILDDCRRLGLAEELEAAEPYAMSLGKAESRNQKAEIQSSQSHSPFQLSAFSISAFPRVAGMDMGPRCWFWCDEVRGPLVSACVWAELIASGNAPGRVPLLMNALGIRCLLLDAGGEPDLTKRLVLALNGLDDYLPPPISRQALLGSHLSHLGIGVTWDGRRGAWEGIRAAAVLFVPGQARGLEQTVGFTQDGRIYPLIKCSRSESIQTAVNDFLSPTEGVIEMVKAENRKQKAEIQNTNSISDFNFQLSTLRALRRARLPQCYIGPGVSQAVLDGHLLNLRRERNPRTQAEDWIEGVENHLGLAKTYARLAQTLFQTSRPAPSGALTSVEGIRFGGSRGVPQFLPARVTGLR